MPIQIKVLRKLFNVTCLPLMFVGLLASCNNAADTQKPGAGSDTVAESKMHDPENALRSLVIADGLQVTTFAT